MTSSHLLVLGSNPETAALVSVAKEAGHTVTVIDPVDNSPAKRLADYSYSLDGFDVDGICQIAKSSSVDGVLIGVLDVLMPAYLEVCNRLCFPCYASENAIHAFSSKSNFSSICSSFGISSIPSYSDPSDLSLSDFPLLIKPVDSGAGMGISICRKSEDLTFSLEKAASVSKSGNILIEKYMQCADMSAYYTFTDGIPTLTATTDRFTSRLNDKGSPVCIGASYPSRHQSAFMADVHPKFLNLFSSLNIQFGVFKVQLFYDGNVFYAYDPGFRLQGEGYHFHILREAGVDQRKMFIDFALGLTYDFSSSASKLSGFQLCRDARALTIWVLLNEGCIAFISGLDLIRSFKSCSYILKRFCVGDTVTSSMLGTEKQVFCRIYLRCDDLASLKVVANDVIASLVVKSESGDNMISDIFCPDVL